MTRRPKHIKRVDRDIDITYVDIETAIERLRAAAEGLNDPHLDIEVNEYPYGEGHFVHASVSGWVRMTREEIREKREEEKLREAQQITMLEEQRRRIDEQLAARRKAAER